MSYYQLWISTKIFLDPLQQATGASNCQKHFSAVIERFTLGGLTLIKTIVVLTMYWDEYDFETFFVSIFDSTSTT